MSYVRVALLLAVLSTSGCITVGEKETPELRAKVVLPLCIQHCEVDVSVEEGSQTPPKPRP